MVSRFRAPRQCRRSGHHGRGWRTCAWTRRAWRTPGDTTSRRS